MAAARGDVVHSGAPDGAPGAGVGRTSGRKVPLRQELSGADDDKIRRIASLIDQVDQAEANQSVLDPIRARLGPLSLPRPLKMRRLLFMPLEPIIVPAKHWTSAEPTIPRSALPAIGALIIARLGDDAVLISKMITGHDVTRLDIIAGAGALLWLRAAETAAVAEVPPVWSETGLPTTAFEPLIRAMSTVWRRATRLRNLQREGEIGALRADAAAVTAILEGAPSESALGCGMIARLILSQSPFAAEHLRLFASASANKPNALILQKVVIRAVAEGADEMQQGCGIVGSIRTAPLDQASDRVRQVTKLLREMQDHEGHKISAARLQRMRDNLGRACLERFKAGMKNELINKLQDGAGPLAASEQVTLETRARDLRMLETTARGLRDAKTYDTLLQAGSEAVANARRNGVVSRHGEIRLTEILAGTEAALRLYRQAPPAS
jgi:hypothetical protein